ncbi:hypothetical protein PR048_015905 [Dryococelus australis]|uniref:Uncharacterized protein n=1 Tax=Dryococelus australis TaxID=614101 RepID=A0ABQ9HJD2_9NEOP|nr:hypothetical protein PR048_015905 [Dryococelus australis]
MLTGGHKLTLIRRIQTPAVALVLHTAFIMYQMGDGSENEVLCRDNLGNTRDKDMYNSTDDSDVTGAVLQMKEKK